MEGNYTIYPWNFDVTFSDGNSLDITDDSVTIDTFGRLVRQYQPSVRFNDGYGEDLLKIFAETMDDIDSSIENIYNELILATANDECLDKIGIKYNIERKQGEGDEKLRKRIQATRLVEQSRGTYRDITYIALTLFEADPQELEIVRANETGDMGKATIRVPENRITNSPFTVSEIESLLNGAVIGGHRIVVEQNDAFTFGDADNGFGTEWGQTF